MQQEMHDSKRVETGGKVVQHNPDAFRKRLQLSHGRRFDDIEDTKKYKARQKRFPCERHGDQSYQLTRDLIDHHKLWIFDAGTPCDPCGRRNADQRDRGSQGDCNRRPQPRRQSVGQRCPQ